MRYIALCAVLATLAPAVYAQTPETVGVEAAPSEPKSTAPAAGSKEIDPALREAAGRQLTLRDPGFAAGEPVVIIPPSAEQPDSRHRWLLGLGIVLLVIAFYMTTRSRDAAPQGQDEDQDEGQPGDQNDAPEGGNSEAHGESDGQGEGGNNGNGHTQAPPHGRGKGDG